MFALKYLWSRFLLGPFWSLSYCFGHRIGGYVQLYALRLLGVKVVGPIWFEEAPTILGYSNLSLGSKIAVGHNSKFICYGAVEIGCGCMMGANFTLNSATHDLDNLGPIIRPIKIGSGVWFGLGVSVCSGVKVGDNSVIGAGSVVLCDIESGSVSVGIPCRKIRTLTRTGGRVYNMFD